MSNGSITNNIATNSAGPTGQGGGVYMGGNSATFDIIAAGSSFNSWVSGNTDDVTTSLTRNVHHITGTIIRADGTFIKPNPGSDGGW